MHTTAEKQATWLEEKEEPQEWQQLRRLAVEASVAAEPVREPGQRGAPHKFSERHLWLSLLWSVRLRMNSYPDWWRLFCTKGLGPFAPKRVSCDALVDHEDLAGLQPLQRIASYVWTRLAEQLAPLRSTTLAAFAADIVIIDETTLDAVHRLLEPLRNLPKGDVRRFSGKLATRFRLRTKALGSGAVPF